MLKLLKKIKTDLFFSFCCRISATFLFVRGIYGRQNITKEERRIRVIGNLTSKEKLFCTYYSISRNSTEAARKSGYRFAEMSGTKLLGKETVKKEIERLDKQRRANEQDISCGYFRLAFGCVSDAVGLLFSQEPTKEQIEGMDLFNISEIKRKKGGEIEIKFFDRLKALEKLTVLSQATDCSPSGSFYAAIEKSALSLKAQQDEQNSF